MAFTFEGQRYMNLEEAVQYLLEQSQTLKNQLDSLSNGALLKTGGIMTGNIILPNAAPTNSLQAVSKDYVDQKTAASGGGGEIIIDFTNDSGGIGTVSADVTAQFKAQFPTTVDLYTALQQRKNITVIDGANYWESEQTYNRYWLTNVDTYLDLRNSMKFIRVYEYFDTVVSGTLVKAEAFVVNITDASSEDYTATKGLTTVYTLT